MHDTIWPESVNISIDLKHIHLMLYMELEKYYKELNKKKLENEEEYDHKYRKKIRHVSLNKHTHISYLFTVAKQHVAWFYASALLFI